LMDALQDELRLPDYFGRNWDALWDVLRDLSWIQARRVVLAHLDLPCLAAPELRIYLRLFGLDPISWTV
ncbi:MAG TPA: barstar family protein, partial [Anaeromyxobacteraceae bacterium]|nr:barstar family protein [Anaeromyxobacteraceae bacterium]